MATPRRDQKQCSRLLITAIVALAMTSLHHFAAAAENAELASQKELCRKLIDEVAGQVHQYCEARQLNTLQCLDFLGTHGSLSNDILTREWRDSLEAAGITLQPTDSTRVGGKILSQRSGDISVLLIQCTLTDATGAELKTFRVRKVFGD